MPEQEASQMDQRRSARGSLPPGTREAKAVVDAVEQQLGDVPRLVALCKELGPRLADAGQLAALAHEGLPDVLLDALERHRQSQDLARLVLPLLAQMAGKGDSRTLGPAEGLSRLLAALQRWIMDVGLVLPALHLLEVAVAGAAQHHSRFLDAGGVEVALAVAKAHPGNATVQRAALALCATATASTTPTSIHSAQTRPETQSPRPPALPQAVVAALAAHALQALEGPESPVSAAAAVLVYNLCSMPGIPALLAERGLLATLVRLLQQPAAQSPLLQPALQIVARLAGLEETYRQGFGQAGIIDLLIRLLPKEGSPRYKDDFQVAKMALVALANLSLNSPANQDALVRLGGVHYAMSVIAHVHSSPAYEPLHGAVVKMLSAMSAHNQQIQALIATGPTGDGVATLVQGMRGAMANGALVSGYAGLLVNLSSDATNHPLLGSQPLLLCLEALERYARDKPVALRLLYAIHNMVSHGGTHAVLAESPGLKVLVDVLELQREDLDYTSLLSKTFFHLSLANSPIKAAIANLGLMAAIAGVLRRHMGNGELLQAFYKLLVNLCSTDGCQMAFIHEGGLELMLHTLRQHPKTPEVQGCVINLMCNVVQTGGHAKVRDFLFASDDHIATLLRVAVQNGPHLSLVAQLLWLVQEISARPKKEAQLVVLADMGLTEALEEAVAQHPDVVALAKHASITLANVSESGEAVALLLMDGALDFVLHLMDRWPENEEVQENGAAFLGNLLPAHRAAVHASGALPAVLRALAEHSAPFTVAEAMNALAKMCRTEAGTTDWQYAMRYGGPLAAKAVMNAVAVAHRAGNLSAAPQLPPTLLPDRPPPAGVAIDHPNLLSIAASALAVLTRPDPTGLTTHGADAPLEGAVAAVLEDEPLPTAASVSFNSVTNGEPPGTPPPGPLRRVTLVGSLANLAAQQLPAGDHVQLGRHSTTGSLASVAKAKALEGRHTPSRESKFKPANPFVPRLQPCNHREVLLQDGGTNVLVCCIEQWQYLHTDNMIVYNLCLVLFHLTLLTKQDPVLDKALLQAGALTVLLNTMLTNSLHANLLALCCKTLAVLCRHSEAARVQAVKLEGLLQVLWNSMLTHSRIYEVQQMCCLVLGNLCLQPQNRAAVLGANGLPLLLASHADTNGPHDPLALARGWVLAQVAREGLAVQLRLRHAGEKLSIDWASRSAPGFVLDAEQVAACQEVMAQWPRMAMDLEEEEEAVRIEVERELQSQWLAWAAKARRLQGRVVRRSVTVSREEREAAGMAQQDELSAFKEVLRAQQHRMQWMEGELLAQRRDHHVALRRVEDVQAELGTLMAWEGRDRCPVGAQTDLLMSTLGRDQRRLQELEADFAALVARVEGRQPQDVATQSDLDKSYMLAVDAKWDKVHRMTADVAQKEVQVAAQLADVAAREKAMTAREEAVQGREERATKAEADNVARTEELQDVEQALEARWEEVQRVEAELEEREAQRLASEQQFQERSSELAGKAAAFEEWLQELTDREMVVATKEACLGTLEDRELRVTLREQRIAFRERAEGALQDREAELEQRVADAQRAEAAVATREQAVSQREASADRRDAALAERHRQCTGLRRRLRAFAEVTEALAREVAEREQCLTQVDRLLTQRERQLTTLWHSVDGHAAEVDAQAQALEAREVAVDGRDKALSKREVELEHREAAMQVRELEADERHRLQEDREAAQNKRHAEQEDRDQALALQARENNEKLAQLAQKEGQQRSKDRELSRREAEVEERDKSLKQQRALLDNRRAELQRREGELAATAEGLEQREDALRQAEDEARLLEAQLGEREAQVEAREGQATTREAEHERRLKELASRQRQFFQREKEAKAQEEDLTKREATLLGWMREMEYREREIEATEQAGGAAMPRLHPGNPDRGRRKFHESLMAVQLRLAKENYVMEKERKLRKARELPTIHRRRDSLVDGAVAESEVREAERTVGRERRLFAKLLAHLRSDPAAAEAPLTMQEDSQLREVQSRDAALLEELQFLAKLDGVPLYDRDSYDCMEHLLEEVDRWWKEVYQELLGRKLRVLLDRKRELDKGMEILQAKVGDRFVTMQTLRSTCSGLDDAGSEGRNSAHSRPHSALAAVGAPRRSTTPGRAAPRPVTAAPRSKTPTPMGLKWPARKDPKKAAPLTPPASDPKTPSSEGSVQGSASLAGISASVRSLAAARHNMGSARSRLERSLIESQAEALLHDRASEPGAGDGGRGQDQTPKPEPHCHAPTPMGDDGGHLEKDSGDERGSDGGGKDDSDEDDDDDDEDDAGSSAHSGTASGASAATSRRESMASSAAT